MFDLIRTWLLMRQLEKIVKNPKPFVEDVNRFGRMQEDMLRALQGKAPKQPEEAHQND